MTGIVDFRTSLLDENDNAINALNPLPTTGGGGGGGVLSDTVFVDSTGQLFVYRDTGTGTPGAFSIPSWGAYTPIGAVTVSSVEISNTVASPVPVSAVSLPLPTDAATEATLVSIDFLLVRMLNALNAPQGYDKSLQRQRGTMVVESGTITTVSSMTAIDGLQGRIQVYGANLSAWADTVRARIT